MSRHERYNEGWHEGRRWAENDLRNHHASDVLDFLRDVAPPANDNQRAWDLGLARGYRDTVARFDSGELTWEMFDAAPLGR